MNDDKFLDESERLFQRRVRDGTFTQAQLQKKASFELVMRMAASSTVAVREALKKRDDTIRELQARIQALENHGIKYAGTWQKAMTYRRGTVVTSDGAMWVALRDTIEGERPGQAQDAWQLAAKGTRPEKSRKSE